MANKKKFMVRYNNLTKSGFDSVSQAYSWALKNVNGFFGVYSYFI